MPLRRLFGLMELTRFFCISPWYTEKKKTCKVIYQISFLTLALTFYIYSLYSYITYYSLNLEPHEKMLLHAIFINVFAINALALINNVFTKRKQWKSMVRKIAVLLGKLQDAKDIKFSTYLPYFLKHSLLIANASFIILTGRYETHMIAISHVSQLQIILLALLIEDAGSILKLTFRKINETIREELDTEIQIESLDFISVREPKEEDPEEIERKTETIRKLVDIYSDCYDIICLYNDVFGWVIVLICLYAVIGVLPGLENIIWKIIPSNYSDLGDVVIRIGFSAWRMCLCVLIIKNCHNATEEGEIIKITATNALQLLPNSKKYDDLENELNLLVNLSSGCPPKFSAAGVFPVDNSLFYVLFTTITSYLVVLIQFIQSPSEDVTQISQ